MKTGQWYHGGMAKPVALDVDTGSDASSVRTESSPLHEKKQFADHSGPNYSQDSGQGSEKENIVQNVPPGQSHGSPNSKEPRQVITRTGSLQGKELKRQFSMNDNLGNTHSPGDPPVRLEEDHRRQSHERQRPSSDREGILPPDGMPTSRRDRHGRPADQSETFRDRDPEWRHGDRRSNTDNRHSETSPADRPHRHRGIPPDDVTPQPSDERIRERPQSRERFSQEEPRRRDGSRHR